MNVFPNKFISPENVYDAWESAKELMTPEQMLDAIYKMIDTDTANWIVENLNTDYELELPQFDDEDEEDYEDEDED